MRGTNCLLAVTTVADEVTGEVKPLFSLPVQVCAAIENGEPSFDIAAPSGGKRKQQYVDEATGEAVEDHECLRGVRIGDEFHAIAPEAIEEIESISKIKTMVALGSEPLENIDFTRATGKQFLQSPVKGGTPKAYRLIYEALLEKKKGGKVIQPAKAIITKRTPRKRQKLCAIYADAEQKCLVLVDLHFSEQLREPDEQVLAPMNAQVEEAQVAMARKVIDSLGSGLEAINTATDDLIPLRQELIEKALNGEEIVVPTPVAETAASDNLEAMLEASLAS